MKIQRKVKQLANALRFKGKKQPNHLSANTFPPENSIPSTFSEDIIKKLDNINGYFNEDDCMHFYLILQMQKAFNIAGDILEIGSYFGRSTALLAHFVDKSEHLVVCDAFENETTDTYANRPTVNNLKQSIQTINPDFDFSKLVIHACLSNELSLPDLPAFRFAHIDGGHDAETAYGDLQFTASRLLANGIIAIDDYQHPDWPGVTLGVERFLSNRKKEFVVLADMNRHRAKGRKLYLRKAGQ